MRRDLQKSTDYCYMEIVFKSARVERKCRRRAKAILFRATNKGLEMATSKETKKFAKGREEIRTHTNRNDLTTRLFHSP